MAEDADPLVLIPEEKWASIFKVYEAKGDPTAKAAIKHQILTKRQFPQYDVLIYAPFSQIDEGIVLAWKMLQTDNTEWHEYCIYSTKIEPSVLMKALTETKIINWESHLVFCGLMPNIYRPIANFLRTNPKLEHVLHEGKLYCLDKAKRKSFDTEHAYTDVDICKIGEKFAEEINETWRYRTPSSEYHLKKMLSRGQGIGIVGKLGGELRGCIFVGLMGELHCLYIKEEYRRKGYARLLIKLMCNKLLENDMEIIGIIAPDNDPSMLLFSSLDFEFCNDVQWIT